MLKRTGTRISAAILLALSSAITFADEQDKADMAVANVLFDYDHSDEFASYVINEDGFVDIIFAQNMPEKLYGEILTKLQNHPDIDGVLSGKGGPVCKAW